MADLDGNPLFEARLLIPDYGPWRASVRGSFDLAVGTAVTLTLIGQEFKGTIIRAKSEIRHEWAFIQAGAGQLGKLLKDRQFNSMPLGRILKATVADDAGEKLSSKSDSFLGTCSWARLPGTLPWQFEVLKLPWRTLPSGEIVVGSYRETSVGEGFIQKLDGSTNREFVWLEEDGFLFPSAKIKQVTYIDCERRQLSVEVEYAD